MKNSASVTPLDTKRSARIGADDVYQAADSLLIEGQKPTIDGVRAKLGRGSPNTINEHLNTWWALLGRRVMGSPGETLSLPKSISDLLLQLWATALQEAHRSLLQTLESREQSADERRTQLDLRETQLAAREHAIDESTTSSKVALDSLNEQLKEQNTRYRSSCDELSMVRSELTSVVAKVQAEQAQRSALQTQLQQSLEVRLRERADFDRHIAATDARALREIDRARVETKENQRKFAETEKALRNELKELKDDLRSKAREHDALQVEHRLLLATRSGAAKGKSSSSKTATKPASTVQRRTPSKAR